MPYEHETAAMKEDEANAVIARVRRSIAARTSDALRRVVIELAPAHTAVALAIREPPFDDLPPNGAAVRTSYRLLCAADGMLYQLAICHAARQLELDVHMCRRGKETARAAQHLGVTPGEIEEFVVGPAGRPARRGRRSTGERTQPASRCWRRTRAGVSGFRHHDGATVRSRRDGPRSRVKRWLSQ